MQLTDFTFNEWTTFLILIAQAGITYYRLKKVEQSTERFHDLFVDFAVHKNAFKNHMRQFEKQSVHVENIIERLDKRIAGIEVQTYEVLIKKSQLHKD